jgi:hypothetical protein
MVRFGLALLLVPSLEAGNFLVPGEVGTPFPTLNHLAVEWEIEGDDDLDATCVVRRCVIRSQYGIKAYRPGMRNALVEDNVLTGIREWKPEIMGAGGENEGEGIQFTGSGNVIRRNRVMGFRDCISHMEDEGAVPQRCNDILNNDILAGLDDGIEADFAWDNCRVLRNRLTNCFVGISSQPGLGGPFEGKIRTRTFHALPGTGFEEHGRVVEVRVGLPGDPARFFDPPDLSGLDMAGAYAGEKVPRYGPGG